MDWPTHGHIGEFVGAAVGMYGVEGGASIVHPSQNEVCTDVTLVAVKRREEMVHMDHMMVRKGHVMVLGCTQTSIASAFEEQWPLVASGREERGRRQYYTKIPTKKMHKHTSSSNTCTHLPPSGESVELQIRGDFVSCVFRVCCCACPTATGKERGDKHDR